MCGKGVDQTLRSAQRWQVLTPELRQRHIMAEESDGGYNIEESFCTPYIDFDVWGALARPVLPIDKTKKIAPKENGEVDDGYPWRKSLGVFDLLSNELVEMVIDNVLKLEDNDLVALGLTCQGFWELVVHRIQTFYVKEAGPWAGKKIVLLGSWSTTVPPSFNDDDMVLKTQEESECYSGKHNSRSLFNWVEAEGKKLLTTKMREKSLSKAIRRHLYTSKVPGRRWKGLKKELECPDLFPMDRDWILRNLTTKEYICEAFRVGVIRAAEIQLVDALLSQICWTSMPSTDWPSDPNGYLSFFTGKWAGHCFDVVPKDVLMNEANPEAWKDVTNEVTWKVKTLANDNPYPRAVVPLYLASGLWGEEDL